MRVLTGCSGNSFQMDKVKDGHKIDQKQMLQSLKTTVEIVPSLHSLAIHDAEVIYFVLFVVFFMFD